MNWLHKSGFFLVAVCTLWLGCDGATLVGDSSEDSSSLAKPVITEATPNRIASRGGTVVSIKGVDFLQNADVRFGDKSALMVQWISSTELSAVAPPIPGMRGIVPLTVVNKEGEYTKAAVKKDMIAYFPDTFQISEGQFLEMPGLPDSFVLMDLQGKGKHTLVSIKNGNAFLSLSAWNQSANQLKTVSFPMPSAQLNSLLTGDFNGDGMMDLVVSSLEGKVFLLISDGRGSFLTPRIIASQKNLCVALTTGFFNADKKLDLVISSAGNAIVLLNQDSGVFVTASTTYIPNNMVDPHTTTGTYDQDEFTDILLVSNKKLYFYAGDKEGIMQFPIWLPMGELSVIAAQLKDLNGDQNPDLLVLVKDEKQNRNQLLVQLRTAKKEFMAPVVYGIAANPQTMLIQDIDQDGYPDVAISGSNGIISVLLGKAEGALGEPLNFVVNGLQFGKLAAGDVTGDGEIDLTSLVDADEFSGLQLFLNVSQ